MLIDQIIISFCMYFLYILYFSYREGAAMLTQPNVLEYQFVVLTPMLLYLHSRQVFPFEAQSFYEYDKLFLGSVYAHG